MGIVYIYIPLSIGENELQTLEKIGSKVANYKKPERTVSYKTMPSKIYFKLGIRSLYTKVF
jgi:hypothetical protein